MINNLPSFPDIALASPYTVTPNENIMPRMAAKRIAGSSWMTMELGFGRTWFRIANPWRDATERE